MRKFWIVMLAVGLMIAFTVPAFAAVGGADVKFSGQYLINGIYTSNPAMKKTDNTTGAGPYAVYDQRFRLQTDFKIAEGLVLVTRFDALEKRWGDTTWNGTYDSNTRPSSGASGAYVQENIEFERVYLDFKTAIGQWQVGYQNFTSWGTTIGDGANTKPGIKYLFATGPITLVAALQRNSEGQVVASTKTYDMIDTDSDAYDLGVIYKWSGGEAGILFEYADLKSVKASAGYASQLYVVDPYAKMTFGPVYVETELIWITGKAKKYESGVTGTDMDANQLGFYIKANVDLKPAYVGAQFLYSSGDDYGSASKQNSGWLRLLNAGNAYEPCLIFGSYWYNHAVGTTATGYATGTNGAMGQTSATAFGAGTNAYSYFFDNVWLAQFYAGVKPIPALDVFFSYTWLKADTKPRTNKGVAVSAANPEFVSDSLGQEIDLKVTYKIFDNLTYMIGGAYFFTGDYFKGTSASNQIDNTYLIMHQLLLNF
jgi:hypothetical protein